jgi:ABC-type Fe3+ transport system substrate-binding protein
MVTKAKWILSAAVTAVLPLAALTACGSSSKAVAYDATKVTVSAGCPDPNGALAKAARKEGNVVMTGTPDGPVRTDLPAAFKKTYGLTMTYIGAPNSQIAAKLAAERKAGKYTHDVFGGGGNTMSTTYYKNGWLGNLKSVLDPKLLTADQWRGGGPKFIDPNHDTILQLSNYVDSGVLINTDQVKPDEIKTFQDVLNPKWKGKIVLFDPRTSGGGIFDVGSWDKSYGDDFIKKLYVDQKPTLLTDQRQAVDGIARGTYALGMSLQSSETNDAIQAGLPVKEIKPTGADQVETGGSSLLAIDSKAPHPNAAKLLVNWLACKDGSAVWMKGLDLPSLRADVPLSPAMQEIVPDPNKSYYDSYDWNVLTVDSPKLTAMLNKLLGPL